MYQRSRRRSTRINDWEQGPRRRFHPCTRLISTLHAYLCRISVNESDTYRVPTSTFYRNQCENLTCNQCLHIKSNLIENFHIVICSAGICYHTSVKARQLHCLFSLLHNNELCVLGEEDFWIWGKPEWKSTKNSQNKSFSNSFQL